MQQHTSTTTSLAWPIPGHDDNEQYPALWAMSPAQRVAAMWRSELTRGELCQWSSRAPDEVPLLADEFAWIVIRTADWAEATDHANQAA